MVELLNLELTLGNLRALALTPKLTRQKAPAFWSGAVILYGLLQFVLYQSINALSGLERLYSEGLM